MNSNQPEIRQLLMPQVLFQSRKQSQMLNGKAHFHLILIIQLYFMPQFVSPEYDNRHISKIILSNHNIPRY